MWRRFHRCVEDSIAKIEMAVTFGLISLAADGLALDPGPSHGVRLFEALGGERNLAGRVADLNR
jgi:hypothetical protein